jgi:hypothetical protein
MASIIVLEDGTGVSTANSYSSAADARSYAISHGSTLPDAGTGIDPVEVALIKAAEYLDSLAWVGFRATNTQALEWPRVLTAPYRNYKFICTSDAGYCLGVDSSYYVLAAKVKAAQCQLVVEQIDNSVILQPTTVGGTQFVTREKVDVIETSYSERLGTLSTPTMFGVNTLLRDLLIPGFGSLRAERV